MYLESQEPVILCQLCYVVSWVFRLVVFKQVFSLLCFEFLFFVSALSECFEGDGSRVIGNRCKILTKQLTLPACFPCLSVSAFRSIYHKMIFNLLLRLKRNCTVDLSHSCRKDSRDMTYTVCCQGGDGAIHSIT